MRSKTVAESTKDTLDSVSSFLSSDLPLSDVLSFLLTLGVVTIQVNKGLGKGLASAIETGEVAGQKVKEAVGASSISLLVV